MVCRVLSATRGVRDHSMSPWSYYNAGLFIWDVLHVWGKWKGMCNHARVRNEWCLSTKMHFRGHKILVRLKLREKCQIWGCSFLFDFFVTFFHYFTNYSHVKPAIVPCGPLSLIGGILSSEFWVRQMLQISTSRGTHDKKSNKKRY